MDKNTLLIFIVVTALSIIAILFCLYVMDYQRGKIKLQDDLIEKQKRLIDFYNERWDEKNGFKQ